MEETMDTNDPLFFTPSAKPTVNQILDQIATLPLNQQTEISRTLHEQIQYRARRQVRPGTKVYFSTKHGVKVEGIVEKVNEKSIKVRANTDRFGATTARDVVWTVSPQLLSVVS